MCTWLGCGVDVFDVPDWTVTGVKMSLMSFFFLKCE